MIIFIVLQQSKTDRNALSVESLLIIFVIELCTQIFFLFSFGHFEDVRLAAIDCLVDLTKSEFCKV